MIGFGFFLQVLSQFFFVSLRKKSVFEIFNIFENNIISVEAAKVVSSRVFPGPIYHMIHI